MPAMSDTRTPSTKDIVDGALDSAITRMRKRAAAGSRLLLVVRGGSVCILARAPAFASKQQPDARSKDL